MSQWQAPGGADDRAPYGQQPPSYGPPVQNGPPMGPPGPGAPPPGPYTSTAARPGVMWLRPQTVGDVLDTAFQTIKANPGATFGVSIMTGLVSLALMAIVVATGGGAVLDHDNAATFGILSLVLLLVSVPVIALVDLASMGGLVHVFSQAVLGHRASIGEAMRTGARRMWSNLGLMLLLALGYLVATVAVVVGLVLLRQADVPVAVIVVLAIIALLAAFALAVRWMFALHVVVMESAGPITALGRSMRLTKGRFWRTFGIMILAWLVVTFVSSVVQMIGNVLATLVFGVSGSFGSSGDTPDGASVAALVGAFLLVGFLGLLVGAFTQPFFLNVVGALYLDARFRDEGLASALVGQTSSAPESYGSPASGGPSWNGYGGPGYGG